ncbi:MAG TPA: hypothetical protein VN947_33775 [Polyangia bacterium]|nr:hypothetical protein [Polyangia bacterium]
MHARALAFVAVLLLTASSSRADETADGKALLAVGIVSDAGSTAMSLACATFVSEGAGRDLDNPGPTNRQAVAANVVTCTLNVALGVAGIAMTVVGAKKLQKGRELHYSLNGFAARF